MDNKKICAYCQTAVKNEQEEYCCSSCNTPYHKDCWNENEGCAVYGCNGKKIIEKNSTTLALKDIIVNIEFLINQHKFEEAIFDSKRYLKVFRNNTELKILYNRAVSLINSKIKLIEDAEQSFTDEDYGSSKIYYENAIKYADENEFNLINAKLDVINERIPGQKRRRTLNRVLTSVFSVLIFLSLIYLGFYIFILKEDREYAEIEKFDPSASGDLRLMELQVAKYENFLGKYFKGRKSGNAREKINKFSVILADKFSENDWRSGLNYIEKVTYPGNMKHIKDLRNKIENQAAGEYNKYISSAKQLNRNRKYNDAIIQLDKAIAVSEYFPDSEFTMGVNSVRSNIDLLNKKISYLIKIQSLEKEILQHENELIKFKSRATESSGAINLSIRVNDEIEPGIFIGKELGTGNLIAVKAVNRIIEPGELITTLSYLSGNYNYENNGWNKIIPLYVSSSEAEYFENNKIYSIERESVIQRLSNLRYQKQRLDSLLSLKLM
jgi:hypothetical protein